MKRPMVIALLVFVMMVGYGFGVRSRQTVARSDNQWRINVARSVPLERAAIVSSTAQFGGEAVFSKIFPQGRRVRANQSAFSPVVDVRGMSRVILRLEASANNRGDLGVIVRFGPMSDDTLTIFSDDQLGVLSPGVGVDIELPVRGPMMQVELLNPGSDDLLLSSGATLYAVP
ncbi:MAG: hypothetical protein RMM98_06100 [Acidobacteriota bacterium]|nr:hypothetical protein [Blastocatellia bacterium]MDW8239169.1 hypothetical protein [Acidobacteriota bacterium]